MKRSYNPNGTGGNQLNRSHNATSSAAFLSQIGPARHSMGPASIPARSPLEPVVPSPQVVQRGAEGRRVHIGARANLEVVSDEVVQIVKILDGYNRHRFVAQPDLLAAWTYARNVVRTGGQTDGRTDGGSDGRTAGQGSPPNPSAPGGAIKPEA